MVVVPSAGPLGPPQRRITHFSEIVTMHRGSRQDYRLNCIISGCRFSGIMSNGVDTFLNLFALNLKSRWYSFT